MKVSADRVVSLSAIFVSLGTLFVILYQTSLMREAQKASVMPYLKMGYTFNTEHQSLVLSNNGLGPAKIEALRIVEGDNKSELDPIQYVRKKFNDQDIGLSNIDLASPGRLIAADERLVMMRVDNSSDQNYVVKSFQFPKDMITFVVDTTDFEADAYIEIEYSSVYGDRWVIKSNEEVPQEL